MTPVTEKVESPFPTRARDGSDVCELLPLGEYLYLKLAQIGTKTIFGVPGDFNLSLLELLYTQKVKDSGLKWVGCCNELNAAYAADGYSRYTNRVGCVVTTYGVGELSALNGIAGAFAENIKLLHVVGVPPTKYNTLNHNIHHLVPRLKYSNLLAPNKEVYMEMVNEKVCCFYANITDLNQARWQIEIAIKHIFQYNLPAYIFIPTDFQDALIPISVNEHLSREDIMPIEEIVEIPLLPSLEMVSVCDYILSLLYSSKTPCIIGDILVERFGVTKQINDLIHKTKLWNFSTFMSKGVLNESNPYYQGVYFGKLSQDHIVKKIQMCDLIIHFGVVENEINTGYYSFNYKPDSVLIQIHPDYVRITQFQHNIRTDYKGIEFRTFVDMVTKGVQPNSINTTYNRLFSPSSHAYLFPLEQEEDGPISHDYLETIIPRYINPGDVVVCETGSIQFTMVNTRLSSDVEYITQGFYLSIGMAIPASLGIGMAMRDYPNLHLSKKSSHSNVPPNYKPRLILLEGDGAAQMTVQEITNIIKYKIPIEILLLNNQGYTIERAIKGADKEFNDICEWNWPQLLNGLGGNLDETKNKYKFFSTTELYEKLKQLKDYPGKETFSFVEVILNKLNIPTTLIKMASELEHKETK
ncbi:hypothetical protein TBLA_0A06420 [Henningerozyma blattae CBS 6284]|uniref:Pyruvate decarboxylase n=1 Tax=Henningerozyma blattae (strain ATCC 34711 / CBS 6284 / DSM 70876 / NBRC 10599 / NRRL Y-10934 / UCD 77-7) TaxID=1071380 RepID=I2GWD2_HENB6|nr:hypothetical protein TBLA_0A06420 [Tetrapisispora blattae CBS 6284]CCH58434.1 hypothetical protein TBLA_0A06420 [Tetrapisispora blattae CBS 6284]